VLPSIQVFYSGDLYVHCHPEKRLANPNIIFRTDVTDHRDNSGTGYSGVASMEQMEQLLPPERQGPLL